MYSLKFTLNKTAFVLEMCQKNKSCMVLPHAHTHTHTNDNRIMDTAVNLTLVIISQDAYVLNITPCTLDKHAIFNSQLYFNEP